MRILLILECKRLLRERGALLALAVLMAACLLAFASGRALITEQIAGRAASQREDQAALTAFATSLRSDLPPEEAILHPYRLTFGVLAPLPPLVDFSAGRASFENYSTAVNLRARPDTLFKRTQTGNAELLVRGGFDMGLVVTVLAPLLLIALGYGLFSSDRDSGVAKLLLAQAGSPWRLLLLRSLPRLALVLLPLMVTALTLFAVGPALQGRTHALFNWLLIGAAFVLFWWAVVLWVNSFHIDAETCALVLICFWALFTLALPAALSALAQASYPPPSRLEQIAAIREAEVASTTGYENDHPDLVSEGLEGRLASIRKSWAIAQQVQQATQPLSQRFEDQRAAQQQLVSRLAWLSPSVIADQALQAQAGTDPRHWADFRRAARTYVDTFGSAVGGFVTRGEVIDPAAFAALPRFDWHPQRTQSAPSLILLMLLSVLLITIARHRFNQAAISA